jgi:hypothetical protein
MDLEQTALNSERRSSLIKKPPGVAPDGFWSYHYRSDVCLFKHIGNVLELRIERAADRIDACDDHNRNAGGDQAIFDGGSARLVFEERKKGTHL